MAEFNIRDVDKTRRMREVEIAEASLNKLAHRIAKILSAQAMSVMEEKPKAVLVETVAPQPTITGKGIIKVEKISKPILQPIIEIEEPELRRSSSMGDIKSRIRSLGKRR